MRIEIEQMLANADRDGVQLETEVEPILVRTPGGVAYDPAWTYTDREGHGHRTEDGRPTLRWIIDETYWCDTCQDEHEVGHWECEQCGEMIKPGTVLRGPEERYLPGRRYTTLNGVSLTDAEADEAARRLVEMGYLNR